MAATSEPFYSTELDVPSSSHEEYHGREIQLHGRPQFNADTTNHEMYKAWELPGRPEPHKVEARPQQLFDADTSYHCDYPEYDVEPHQRHQAEPWKANPAQFDANSSYSQDFQQHPLEKRPPMLPVNARNNTAPFDGHSSYSDQYPAHKVEPRQVHASAPYTPNTAQLDGHSAYSDEFKVWELPSRPEPHREAPRPQQPFNATSSYDDTFKAHALETRQVHKSEYQYKNTPLDGESESHEKFKKWELEARAPHATPPLRPTLRFEGSTTSHDAFRGYQLPAKRVSLGIATLGDNMHMLLPSSLDLPCTMKKVFTTSHHDQKDMSMLFYMGDNPVASKNKLVGQFHLHNLPPARLGSPKMEVTFHLSKDCCFNAEARDLDSGRHFAWSNGGGKMVAGQPASSSPKDLPALTQ